MSQVTFMYILQVRYLALLTREKIKDIMVFSRDDALAAGIPSNSVSILTFAEAISTLKALDSKQFFPQGYFVVNWYPLLASPDNYELILQDVRSKVSVTKDQQGKVIALSFLTFFQNHIGFSLNLDFYGKVSGNIKLHIAKAFQYTYDNMMSKNSDFQVSIFLGEHKESERQDIMDYLHNKLSLPYSTSFIHGDQIVARSKWAYFKSKV